MESYDVSNQRRRSARCRRHNFIHYCRFLLLVWLMLLITRSIPTRKIMLKQRCHCPEATGVARLIKFLLVLVFALAKGATSFLSPNSSGSSGAMRSVGSEDQNEKFADMLFLERFRRRKLEMEQRVEQEQGRRPPNADLSAQETVREILLGLLQPHDPQRYFGLEILLRACTAEWRAFLCQSVAATANQDDTSVAAALEAAMSRPHNQFRILLGLEDEGYKIDFPTEPLDYSDGTCWLECRLRANDNDKNELLTGTRLQNKRVGGGWLGLARFSRCLSTRYRKRRVGKNMRVILRETLTHVPVR